MPKDTKRLEISLLESQVVLTINTIGWHAYLWFPVVQREILSFGLDDADEKVHAAIVGLVKKGALMVTKAYLGCDPEWSPVPGVLEAALENRRRLPDLAMFGSHRLDGDVHAAWVSLVRKGALVCKQEKWGHIPEWDLAPGVLKTAGFIGLGGRKI